MNTPAWLTEAWRHVGVREISGNQHAAQVLRWWKDIRRGGIRDDETPWCAAFVGACLESVGVLSTRHESARSYLDWGVGLSRPLHGSVVVMGRAGGGGHVGFCVGVDRHDNPLVLGGNQEDEVNVRLFARGRVLGYRWPSGVGMHDIADASLVGHAQRASSRES